MSNTPRPTPKPKGDALINDVLLAIVDELSPPQLAVCARVSRFFYAATTPILYCTVDIDLFEDINPLLIKLPSEGKIGHFSSIGPRINEALAKMGLGRPKVAAEGKEAKKDKMGVFRRMKSAKAKSAVGEAALPPRPIINIIREPIPPRFSFTTHLTITAHPHSICGTLSPLIMPLLRDLRITSGWLQSHLDFCQCRHFTDDNGQCTQPNPCICPLISHLRPQRLLIGTETTGITGSGLGLLNGLSTGPLSSVKQIVVFAGNCTGLEIGAEREFCWLENITHTIEKLSVVLQPMEGLWAVDGKWRFRRVPGFEDFFEAELLWKKLALALSGKAGQLEVVGVETVDTDWTEMSVQEEEEAVRKALHAKLVSKGWKIEDAAERAKAIKFFERREFDERK